MPALKTQTDLAARVQHAADRQCRTPGGPTYWRSLADAAERMRHAAMRWTRASPRPASGVVAKSSKPKLPAPRRALAMADGPGLDERVFIRGNHKNLGEVAPRRFLEALAGAGQPAPDLRQRPAGAGPAPDRSRQSAGRPRHGQPPLEASLRRGHRPQRRQLRRPGRAADASGAARLPGGRVRQARLVDQGDAPADGAVRHVSDGSRRGDPEGRRARPAKPAAAPDADPPAGSGGDPRLAAGGLRPARPHACTARACCRT